MAVERDPIRDWHRLFGMVLTDYFTATPFTVVVERDVSEQQQLLDVLIVRREPGPMPLPLPDGLTDLTAHNLITFKSHREALTDWAMKELLQHYVAYRKIVSLSPTDLLPEDQFRLYAVCARFPQQLSSQVPWRQRQAGVYDCQWATDVVRVIVVGELPQQEQNAPLHLFSASLPLLRFGRSAYQQRSPYTSRVLSQLLEEYLGEGSGMAFTIEDFNRWYIKDHFYKLTPQEQQEALARLPAEQRRQVLATLPPEELLSVLSADQIRQYLDQLDTGNPTKPRKSRRKK